LGIDRLEVSVDGALFARYTFAGTRRPYLWPVIGPSGHSVVRGAGGVDHPHHTGLSINYGGHSEGGSSNIWSDWDEAPYGPGGRIVHRDWLSVSDDEAVEELVYVDADGNAILDEIRTMRFSWASPSERFIDFNVEVRSVRDAGPRPMLMMVRASERFDIPKTGRVTTSAGIQPPDDYYREGHAAEWIDLSGPTGRPPARPPAGPPEILVDIPGALDFETGPGTGPWNGVAILDHPSNFGFPNTVGKYSVTPQATQAHYPPPDAPDGPYTFKSRIYVHDGDAESGDVAAHAAAYQLT
jgi:hypothetical protein